jgi:alkanesulfonate monooxygenase SsuD/methylene tetrahydromethanopterin reductase-like flavin-dependent oxidoreductase (luciferase family)
MALGYIGGGLQHLERTLDIYREAGGRAGHPPDVLQVATFSHFYVGEDPRAARDRVFPFYHEYLRPKTPGGRGFDVDRASFDAGSVRGGAIMMGSSEELAEKITDLRDLLGVDRFMGQIDFGGMPRAMVEESITRLATEVCPAIRTTQPAAAPGARAPDAAPSHGS